MHTSYTNIDIPESKKRTGKICYISTLTGINSDMDSDIHKGFTVGKGKTLYWYMVWHNSGNVTVYRQNDGEGLVKRYLSGDQEITIHFK